MKRDPTWAGRTVCVTGGTGFSATTSSAGGGWARVHFRPRSAIPGPPVPLCRSHPGDILDAGPSAPWPVARSGHAAGIVAVRGRRLQDVAGPRRRDATCARPDPGAPSGSAHPVSSPSVPHGHEVLNEDPFSSGINLATCRPSALRRAGPRPTAW